MFQGSRRLAFLLSLSRSTIFRQLSQTWKRFQKFLIKYLSSDFLDENDEQYLYQQSSETEYCDWACLSVCVSVCFSAQLLLLLFFKEKIYIRNRRNGHYSGQLLRINES